MGSRRRTKGLRRTPRRSVPSVCPYWRRERTLGACHVCISSTSCVWTSGYSPIRSAPSAEWTLRPSCPQRADALATSSFTLIHTHRHKHTPSSACSALLYCSPLGEFLDHPFHHCSVHSFSTSLSLSSSHVSFLISRYMSYLPISFSSAKVMHSTKDYITFLQHKL